MSYTLQTGTSCRINEKHLHTIPCDDSLVLVKIVCGGPRNLLALVAYF